MKMIYSAPSSVLQRWFWWLLIANVAFVVCLHFYLQPLLVGEMVRFETARTASVAEGILQEWKASGKYAKAVESIYLDYPFIILYASGLAVGCAFLSRLTRHEILVRAGKGASYLLAGAAVCDVIENVVMLRSLQGAVVQQWNVTVAYDMAATKFSVIIISCLFMLVCAVFAASNRFSGFKL